MEIRLHRETQEPLQIAKNESHLTSLLANCVVKISKTSKHRDVSHRANAYVWYIARMREFHLSVGLETPQHI